MVIDSSFQNFSCEDSQKMEVLAERHIFFVKLKVLEYADMLMKGLG